MIAGSALAVGAGALVGAAAPAALPLAAPLLALWGAAPLIAKWLSRPIAPRDASAPLSAADRRELRLCARKTWYFFETFVTAEENWLPPDNFQEEPRPSSLTAPRPPTSAFISSRSSRRAISASSLSARSRSDSAARSRRSSASRSARGTSSTGTRRRRGSPSIRATYPPSTAAIWQHTSGRSAPPAPRWPLRRSSALRSSTPRSTGSICSPPRSPRPRSLRPRPSPSARRCGPRSGKRAIGSGRTGERPSRLSYRSPKPPRRLALSSQSLAPRPLATGAGSWAELTHRGLVRWVDEIRALAPFAESLAGVPEALSSGARAAAWGEVVQGLSAAWTSAALMEEIPLALSRIAAIEESLGAGLAGTGPGALTSTLSRAERGSER